VTEQHSQRRRSSPPGRQGSGDEDACGPPADV